MLSMVYAVWRREGEDKRVGKDERESVCVGGGRGECFFVHENVLMSLKFGTVPVRMKRKGRGERGGGESGFQAGSCCVCR